VVVVVLMLAACQEEGTKRFMPYDELSAQFYLQESVEYSDWYKLLHLVGIEESFNFASVPLTCFVVRNEVLAAYLQAKGYGSVEQMVESDMEFAKRFIRYHTVVMRSYELADFRNGKLRDSTASGDYLVCRFADGADGGVYINHVCKIIRWDIKVANGYIHELSQVIDPVVETLHTFLTNDVRYSIFARAVALTNNEEIFSRMEIEHPKMRSRRTIFVTPDSIYRENGVNSIEELQARVSPGRTDFTEPSNPLNLYVRYHLVEHDYTSSELSELFDLQTKFVNKTQGYTMPTLAENKLILIQAEGLSFLFNRQVKFTDRYNIQLRNGFAHEIDGLLEIFDPENILTTFEATEAMGFWSISEYRNPSLQRFLQTVQAQDMAPDVTWTTTPPNKVNPVAYVNFTLGSYNRKSLYMYGDYIWADLGPVGEITFQTRPIPKGIYKVSVCARRIKQEGGTFQPYIDGVKTEGVLNVYDPTWDYDVSNDIVAKITFEETRSHRITFKTTKAGQFELDAVIFTPTN
jgi:uncharacterized surface protein with fasciclin (FAS1) repeats